jgi:hypothetical protein
MDVCWFGRGVHWNLELGLQYPIISKGEVDPPHHSIFVLHRSRIVGLYLHSHIYLHGIMLNQLSTGTILPLTYLSSQGCPYKEVWCGRVVVLPSTESERQENIPPQGSFHSRPNSGQLMCDLGLGAPAREKAKYSSFLRCGLVVKNVC